MSVASLRAIQRIAARGRERSSSNDKETALFDIKVIAEELCREHRAWTLGDLRYAAAVFQCGENKNNGRRFLTAFLDVLESTEPEQ